MQTRNPRRIPAQLFRVLFILVLLPLTALSIVAAALTWVSEWLGLQMSKVSEALHAWEHAGEEVLDKPTDYEIKP